MIERNTRWSWVMVMGMAFVLLGIFALTYPVASTVGLAMSLGFLFILAGCVLGIHAVQFRHEEGNGWRVLQCAIAIVAGFLMVRYPRMGMMTTAILMTFYFFVTAATRAMLAFSLRTRRGWGWLTVGAIASFFLGAYIVVTFPISALWVPGLLLGIDLVIHGTTLIGASADLRSLARKPVIHHA